MHKLPSGRCWWCCRDERQSLRHLLGNGEAWRAQIQELWKEVGKRCGWKHLKTPRIALLFNDERATKAVLSFLRRTKVRQMVTIGPRGGEDEEEGEEEGPGEREEAEGEERGPGIVKGRSRWRGPPPGREVSSGGFLFCLCFGLLFFVYDFWYAGVPAMTAESC